MHPVTIHRIDIEGDRVVRRGDNGRIMPGFQRLDRLECGIQLTFVATAATNNIILQCVMNRGRRTFSRAIMLGVKGIKCLLYNLHEAPVSGRC